jgi:hypothetical protein
MMSELITGYINLKEGGSVSDQFEKTFDGAEGFDEQNPNALKYVLIRCKQILNDSPFEDDYELRDYVENLEDYLKKNKDDE